MPAKNSQKSYTANGYYHIYNRGVEKRKIFLDDIDYRVFLSYLKEYLLPKDTNTLITILSNPKSSPKNKHDATKLLRMNNFFGDITLISHCLMPNHFHFLIHQNTPNAMDSFMNSIGTRYTMYFNRKNQRVGTLYQGVYKAVLIRTDEQLLQISRYIHRNSLELALKGLAFKGSPFMIQPSSYPEYIGLRKTEWLHPEPILEYFSKSIKNLSYESFVNQDESLENIYDLLIDM